MLAPNVRNLMREVVPESPMYRIFTMEGLGAEALRIRRMVVLQGARVTLAGVAFGLSAALTFTRVLDSLLF